MWPTFLWKAGGLSKRISEKGRCESDPMVDKKKREWPRYSIRAPVVMQYPSFFFFSRDSHGACTRCAKSEAKCLQSTYAHLSGKIIVGQAIVSYPSRPILCRSATESVARDGTPPCPHHFRAPSPRAAPSGLLMSSAPTTRSRTLLFLSYRDSRASSSTSHHKYALDNDGDENERLIDTPKDHIAIDVGLPPKWSGNLRR